MQRSPDYIQSLERGLAVIRTFDANHSAQTLTEVAKDAGLSKATARRCLHTLVELGYAGFDGRLFSLRAKILELGYSYLASFEVPEIAHPHLQALATAVEEACSMAVLDGDQVAYVARVSTPRIMSVSISVGSRFPAHVTSMGRVLMAAQSESWLDAYFERAEFPAITRRTTTSRRALSKVLAQVRSRGYAINDQELEDGVRSVAVPIHARSGETVAAINISTSAFRRSLDDLEDDLLPALQETARKIESDLARR